jgi:hypothetical protein
MRGSKFDWINHNHFGWTAGILRRCNDPTSDTTKSRKRKALDQFLIRHSSYAPAGNERSAPSNVKAWLNVSVLRLVRVIAVFRIATYFANSP